MKKHVRSIFYGMILHQIHPFDFELLSLETKILEMINESK